jgi:oxygen-independent coproporphyrinogen-3 oxidase
MEKAKEWTIECNPGSVGQKDLEAIRALGFNRVSLGVQSLEDHHLISLGRIHDSRQSLDSYQALRRAGFQNVNLDLIFGLPGQTLDEWHSDLTRVLALNPEHLSLYHLTIESGTEFGNRLARGEMAPVDQDLGADMYELAMDLTQEAGFEQYEISNFCRTGKQSRHNLVYWNNRPYLGFGISAASFIGGIRWTNTGQIQEYTRTAHTGSPTRASQEQLKARNALGEEVMLRLRTRDGFSLDVSSLYQKSLESFSKRRLVRCQGDRVRLTRQGKLLANEVCQELL